MNEIERRANLLLDGRREQRALLAQQRGQRAEDSARLRELLLLSLSRQSLCSGVKYKSRFQ